MSEQFEKFNFSGLPALDFEQTFLNISEALKIACETFETFSLSCCYYTKAEHSSSKKAYFSVLLHPNTEVFEIREIGILCPSYPLIFAAVKRKKVLEMGFKMPAAPSEGSIHWIGDSGGLEKAITYFKEKFMQFEKIADAYKEIVKNDN